MVPDCDTTFTEGFDGCSLAPFNLIPFSGLLAIPFSREETVIVIVLTWSLILYLHETFTEDSNEFYMKKQGLTYPVSQLEEGGTMKFYLICIVCNVLFKAGLS